VSSANIELLDTDIFDAYGFVERLFAFEQKFNAQITAKDFEIENFRRIETICKSRFPFQNLCERRH
jgi:hypothetical protein